MAQLVERRIQDSITVQSNQITQTAIVSSVKSQNDLTFSIAIINISHEILLLSPILHGSLFFSLGLVEVVVIVANDTIMT